MEEATESTIDSTLENFSQRMAENDDERSPFCIIAFSGSFRTVIRIMRLLFLLAILITTARPAGAEADAKILYIDSYHKGYEWSDGILEGIRRVLKGRDLEIFRMDTKRNSDEEYKKEKALEAKALIESLKPDVVIASDDNASKYLLAPYYRDSKIPFVFCGLNWQASAYGFPTANITGMIEVPPAEALIKDLAKYREDKIEKLLKLGFLSSDDMTSRKEAKHWEELYRGLCGEKICNFKAHFSNSIEEWKKVFKEMQNSGTPTILYNNSQIEGWDPQEMVKFTLLHTKSPTAAVLDWMKHYALLTYSEIPQEQGEWAAHKALEILDGTPVRSIKIERNKRQTLRINVGIAQALKLDIPFEILESADELVGDRDGR